jgi:hypothetical protein
MTVTGLAEPKLFKGSFSLGSESVEAEIRVGITKRTSFSAAQGTASLGVSSAAPH